MKKNLILLCMVLFSAGLISCENWLDIQPADTVTEEELFKEGAGYRVALNGVYRQLASSTLFGRNLSWGTAEALAQSYDSYSGISSTDPNSDLMAYKYTTDRAKTHISSIWSAAYNAVANCNNIIGRIESEPDSKFKEGKMEREMILGEALALRAFIHFQILVYFAPAPIKASTGNYIPYYETFPLTGSPYLTVNEVLERIVRDLKRGQELVQQIDTYQQGNTNHRRWLWYKNRFSPKGGYSDNNRPKDIFFAFRGYRMNYLAVTAILARAYNYQGQIGPAAEEAKKVIDFMIESEQYALDYTPATEVEGNYKMSYDLIFGLSDENLIQNYASFNSGSDNNRYQLSWDYPDIYDSESDYRLKNLIIQEGWNCFPARFTTPKKNTDQTAYVLDLIPIIRLSEMHLILAEQQAEINQFTAAADFIDAVRIGRGCPSGMLHRRITDYDSFVDELLDETRREFVEEGLIFYYYKKFGRKCSYNMTDDKAYFPLPDNETVF